MTSDMYALVTSVVSFIIIHRMLSPPTIGITSAQCAPPAFLGVLTDTLEIFSGRLVLELILEDCLSALLHGQSSEIGNCRQKKKLEQRQGNLSIFGGAEQFDLAEV